MIFNSQRTNNDPYPFIWSGHSKWNQMRADTDMFRKGAPAYHPTMDYRYRPRPEYDNNPNPILLDFRANKGSATEWWGMLAGFNPGSAVRKFIAEIPEEFGEVTQEHRAHAALVLYRLRRLRGEA